MIFFDPYYLLGLIAGALIFWTLIPEQFRTYFIIAASFIGLAFIQIKFTILLMILIVMVYLLALIIKRQQKGKIRFLVGGILGLALVLLIGKYAGNLLTLIFSEETSFAQKYLVPLGISYLCFKLIAFLIDVYRGKITDPGLDQLMAFILFVPTFPAGPIERYQNFAQKRINTFDQDFFSEGLRRMAIGYFKKVVIVNFILNETLIKRGYPMVLLETGFDDVAGYKIILILIGSLIYAYIDLSAYADIAIGFGHLYGYKVIENMRYPIFQKNISDFWSRWHISLSSWCRDNVYFPVLGKTRNLHLGLYASFAVMGLWHNISLNWLLWGMWHATGIIIFNRWNRFKVKNKKLRGLLPSKLSYGLGMTATALFAAFGYAFIITDRSHGFIGSAVQAFKLLMATII